MRLCATNLKPETKKAQRTLCSSIQPKHQQKNLRAALCKNIFISLHFDKAQYKLAQGENRVKQIFKIIPIPPIYAPKNSTFKNLKPET